VPRLVAAPQRIPVPGGKSIEEYAGRVATGDTRVSVAVMRAPAGWSEPAQVPAFAEVTVVLDGSIVVEHDGGAMVVTAGQAVVTEAGERVRYRVDDAAGAWYVAVCLPAFAPDLARREEGEEG
jgi:uncharacterized cupin superfamily protein